MSIILANVQEYVISELWLITMSTIQLGMLTEFDEICRKFTALETFLSRRNALI
jgi:hypothetical protein